MAKPKTIALIQARVSSSRLPFKHFRTVGDKSILEWILTRLSTLVDLDDILISTCREPGSELFKQYQDRYNYKVFEYEGDVNDVAERHYRATQFLPADYYLYISGDCPLIGEELIQDMLKTIRNRKCDRVVVDGQTIHEGISICSRESIRFVRNHSFTHEQKENFGYQVDMSTLDMVRIPVPEKYRPKPCRISVDNMADLRFMKAVYGQCNRHKKIFCLESVIEILESHPELLLHHKHVRQKKVGFQPKKFLLWTHAAREIGFGHLARMIGLAQELNETYHHGIAFLVNEDKEAIEKLTAEGYDKDYYIYQDTIPLRALQNLSYDTLIVDVAGVDDTHPFLRNLTSKKVFFYDSLPKTNHADAYLIQGIQPTLPEKKQKVYSGWGTIFLNKRLEYEILRHPCKQGFFVSLGASDPQGWLPKVVAALKNKTINLVLGKYRTQIDENYFLPTVHVLSQKEIPQATASCEKAICAFGVTFYELLISGAQVLVLTRNDHDRQIVTRLAEQYACAVIEPDELDADNFMENFHNMRPGCSLYEMYRTERRQLLETLLYKKKQ